MSDSATPWTATHQASLSFTISQSLLKLRSIESVMPSNHLILCRPLLLLPSVFPSIRVFSSESVLHIRWPKYWSLSFSISPSSEYSGLIPFRTDCSLKESQESSPTHMSSAYLRLLIFLPAILIPACASSSPMFLMIYFAYKLNKQGDVIQPCCTPFPVCCSMSSSDCCFLTCMQISQEEG